jgi:PAS domain S-box-containing protein
VLEALSPQVRDDLLRFYLELDDSLSCEEVLVSLLGAFSHSLPFEHRLVISVPTAQGWLSLSSVEQRLQGALPCPPDWAAPPGWSEVGMQTLQAPGQRGHGWLKVWSPKVQHGSVAQSLLLAWGRVAQQLVNRHCYHEMHHSYSALVEAAVDAIITIDSQGLIRQFNPGAVRMFGYSADEIMGQGVSQLMPPPYSVEHDQYMRNYQSSGEKKIIGIGRKVPARRKDGSIFPAHLAVTEFERAGEKYFIGTLRDLSEFVEARSRAVVEERKHLSRELHDSVSQALFGIVLGTLAIQKALDPHDPSREAVDYVLHLAESGLAEMRTLIFELRPESLESEGLLVCLNNQAQALAKRYKIQVKLESSGQEPGLELPIKHEVYRVVMESLHNVVKHAQASCCTVRLVKEPGEYQVSVEDNGRGFDLAAVPVNRVGLSSIRERVAQLGGRISIQSAPGQGTSIRVNFPASNDS